MDARLLADLQALIRSAKTPLIEAQNDAKGLQLAVGQKVEVRVVALLPEGRAEVRFGEQRLNVNLPARYGIGSSLPLTVMATTPHLQFALAAQTPPSSAANTQLSDSAQLLAAVRDAVSQASTKTVSPPLLNTPISNVPPNTGEELAAPLRQAIVLSGYFYEAHQEQWVVGARSTAALKQEPQNLSQALPLADLDAGAGASAAEPAQTIVAAPATDDVLAGSQPATTPNPLDRIVSPHTQALVHQQLSILDGQPIVWQGDVWPGQKMRWEIEPDPEGADALETAPAWRTTVEVTLPRLGPVRATLSLTAGSLALRLDASPDTLADLAAAQDDLRQRMASAGLNLAAPTLVERG